MKQKFKLISCILILIILQLRNFSTRSQDRDSQKKTTSSEFNLKWITKQKAPEKRGFCSEAINGIIYSVVCDNPNVYLYKFDPVQDIWSERILLKSKRYEVWSLKEKNGKLYHFHGMESGVRSPSVEEIDPDSLSSRIITDKTENMKIRKEFTFDFENAMPGLSNAWRWGPFYLNHKRYLLYTEPEEFPFVCIYEEDAGNKVWIKRANMPHPRVDAGIIVANNMIYTFGGWFKSGGQQIVSDLIEAYDPSEDRWIGIGTMTEPRWAMGLAVVNSKFYLIGGLNKDYQKINLTQELEIMR